MAMAYGHVFVAQVAFGAKDAQTLKRSSTPRRIPGPSLIIAYSHCIAHGYDMAFGLEHQRLAADSGYWPLYHYDPRRADLGREPARARLAGAEDRRLEADGDRDALPADAQQDPDRYRDLVSRAQLQIQRRLALYQELASRPGSHA
jgi:pyruvate-ferredoxin/flavodoxin oxidoreductase